MALPKVRLGDVFQIPLPEGKFAYGRVYDDASVSIYRKVTEKPFQPPIGARDFLFTVGLYSDILENGYWEIIDRDEFEAGESPWPPPYFVRDVISGDYQIYHKGVLRPAEPQEVVGLEEAAVYDADHIVDRIIRELDE